MTPTQSLSTLRDFRRSNIAYHGLSPEATSCRPSGTESRSRIHVDYAIISEPASDEESLEMNAHWIIAAIRVYSRPFAV